VEFCQQRISYGKSCNRYGNRFSTGTATITYSLGAGCAATKIVTVNAISAITGSMGMCLGTTTVLADAITGGFWGSGTTTVATVGSAGSPSAEVVTGVLGRYIYDYLHFGCGL